MLKPGDCLYLPRGFLHAATALGGVSTHLTIGVHSWTRYALAEQLLQQALRTVAADSAVRGSLALGVDFADSATLRSDVELARSALVAALQQADVEQLAATLRTQRPRHPAGRTDRPPEAAARRRSHRPRHGDRAARAPGRRRSTGVGQRLVLRSRAATSR